MCSSVGVGDVVAVAVEYDCVAWRVSGEWYGDEQCSGGGISWRDVMWW